MAIIGAIMVSGLAAWLLVLMWMWWESLDER